MAEERINSELDYMEKVDRKPLKQKIDWMAKEIFYQSRDINKLTGNLDAIEKRVTVIENNCKINTCQTDRQQTNKNKNVAVGAGIGAGGLGAIYVILKAVLANYGITI